MGRFKQPDATLSEPATTPPISCQTSLVPSTVSSTISHKASLLSRAVKKGVKDGAMAIVRPFKQARKALSSHATGDDIPALEDVDDGQDGDDEDGSGAGSADSPEKQLGICIAYVPHSFLLSGYSETKAYLALNHLQLFQTRSYCSVPSRSPMPFLCLRRSSMQNLCWWCTTLSGLEGQVIDGQPQAPRNEVLWRRGGYECRIRNLDNNLSITPIVPTPTMKYGMYIIPSVFCIG